MTKTSVVVVSHHPGSWLEPCLSSALAQADEVIVVDNASEGWAASQLGDRLGTKTVRANVNLGFAGGVNLGVSRAKGDLIAFLNDDAIAGPGWLGSAAELLTDPTVAAVTPKVLLMTSFAEVAVGRPPRKVLVSDADVTDRIFSGPGRVYVPVPEDADPDVRLDGEVGRPIRRWRLLNHAGVYLHRRGYIGDFGLGAPDDGRFDHPAERFGCSGAAPVFRAETLHRIGPFAEEYFAYNEDFDWCFRARLAGMRFLYDPRSSVDHLMSATSGGDRNLPMRLLSRRNQLLTLVRNAPTHVAAEHLTRATLSPHRQGVRRAVAKRLPWATSSRKRLRQGWAVTPDDVWRRWAGVDEDWGATSVGADRPANVHEGRTEVT